MAQRPARAAAMDLLARREHSLKELQTKLRARDYPEEEIEAALAALVREGLADDGRFVEAFIASRIRKGHGPIRIRAELTERGIDAETIGRCLPDAHDWRALAREVRARRFGPASPADFGERARQARFLEYRGFTGEQVRGSFGGGDDD